MNITARLAIVALTILGSTAGCAMRGTPADPPTTSGRIAQSGRQVIAAAESVLQGLDELGTQKVITPADVVRVATIIKRVGVEGERLSKVLLEVNASDDAIVREQGFARAAEILKVIQRLVTDAGGGISTDAGRTKVAGLLGQITDMVLSIAMLFPAPVTP